MGFMMIKKEEKKIVSSEEIAKAFERKISKKIETRRKRIRAVATIVASLTATGCTTFGASSMFSDSDRGFVMLAGDAEGIRAYNDGLNGIISNTRVSKDTKSPYWQNRDNEVEVRKMSTPYFSPKHPRFSYTKQRSVNKAQY